MIRVLQEGTGWLVVDKPSGLACHRSALVRDRDTLAVRLRAQLGQPIHLVHRLDRAASGCLVVALDPATTAALQDALTGAHKEYLALVRGFFRWDDPVRVATDVPDSRGVPRAALTWVDAIGRSLDPRCSLLRAVPATGRHHQVRRHLRDLDHPILGDHAHGDTRENTAWRPRGLARLALHCWRIRAPEVGLHATAPLPEDLLDPLSRLPWWPTVSDEVAPGLRRPDAPAAS